MTKPSSRVLGVLSIVSYDGGHTTDLVSHPLLILRGEKILPLITVHYYSHTQRILLLLNSSDRRNAYIFEGITVG